MNPTEPGRDLRPYRVTRRDGGRCVVYNASAIGDPGDHAPGKWYWQPYPVPLGLHAGEAFDTAGAAEVASRAAG